MYTIAQVNASQLINHQHHATKNQLQLTFHSSLLLFRSMLNMNFLGCFLMNNYYCSNCIKIVTKNGNRADFIGLN